MWKQYQLWMPARHHVVVSMPYVIMAHVRVSSGTTAMLTSNADQSAQLIMSARNNMRVLIINALILAKTPVV